MNYTYTQIPGYDNTVTYKIKIEGVEFPQGFLKTKSDEATIPISLKDNIDYAARQVFDRWKGYNSEVFTWN